MERKFPVKNLGTPHQGVRKFSKMLLQSPLKISGNSNRTFWWNGKRSGTKTRSDHPSLLVPEASPRPLRVLAREAASTQILASVYKIEA